jgi:tetratricopeptide (TPR) repeat protein
MRTTALVIIAAAALFALQRWCVEPFACNRVKGRVEPEIVAIAALPDNIELTIRARAMGDQIRKCLEHAPHDVDLHMEAAAVDQILHRPGDAITQYTEALQYDRRPELYLNLGLMQYEMGDKQGATQTLGRSLAFATYFINYDPKALWSGERTMDHIPPDIAQAVEGEAARVRQKLLHRQ